jgi:integrase
MRWAQSVETDIERGIYKPPSADRKTTVSDLLDRYGREVAPSLKGQTQVMTRIAWWKQQPIAKRSVYDIKPSDFHAHRRAREAAGKASSTIRNEMNLVSKVFIVAREEWSGFEALENPLEGVKRMRKEGMPEGRKRRLSYPAPYDCQDEEGLILAHAQTPMRQLFLLAVETAMRRGELLSLRWSWVHDFKNGKVAILPDTKNGTARTVPLSKRAQSALAELKGRLKKTDHIFGDLTENALTLRWSALCAKLGLEDLRFHDLRHEATSRLVETGMRLDEVRLITGHKSLELLSRYTHPRVEDVMRYFE